MGLFNIICEVIFLRLIRSSFKNVQIFILYLTISFTGKVLPIVQYRYSTYITFHL